MVCDLRRFKPVPNLLSLNKIFGVIWMKYANYNINSKAMRQFNKSGGYGKSNISCPTPKQLNVFGTTKQYNMTKLHKLFKAGKIITGQNNDGSYYIKHESNNHVYASNLPKAKFNRVIKLLAGRNE